MTADSRRREPILLRLSAEATASKLGRKTFPQHFLPGRRKQRHWRAFKSRDVHDAVKARIFRNLIDLSMLYILLWNYSSVLRWSYRSLIDSVWPRRRWPPGSTSWSLDKTLKWCHSLPMLGESERESENRSSYRLWRPWTHDLQAPQIQQVFRRSMRVKCHCLLSVLLAPLKIRNLILTSKISPKSESKNISCLRNNISFSSGEYQIKAHSVCYWNLKFPKQWRQWNSSENIDQKIKVFSSINQSPPHSSLSYSQKSNMQWFRILLARISYEIDSKKWKTLKK